MSQGIKLLLWIFAILTTSIGISMWFQPSVNLWYDNLSKSSLTPPGYIFGIVWPILYLCIATAGWYIFNEETIWEKSLFTLQLILNYSWTPVFFYYQQAGLGVIVILSLSFLTSYLVGILYQRGSKAALLLTPYLFWLYFASYLNYIIWYKL